VLVISTTVEALMLTVNISLLALLNGLFEIAAVALLLIIELPYRLPTWIDKHLKLKLGFLTDPLGRILFATYLALLSMALRGDRRSAFALAVSLAMIITCMFEFVLFIAQPSLMHQTSSYSSMNAQQASPPTETSPLESATTIDRHGKDCETKTNRGLNLSEAL
jgi:hypothetical protein